MFWNKLVAMKLLKQITKHYCDKIIWNKSVAIKFIEKDNKTIL